MDNCEFALKLIGLALSTWFWCWYLTWEYEHFSGRRPATRWWEKNLITEKQSGKDDKDTN